VTKRSAETAGMTMFLALSFLGSWFVAASLRVFDLNAAPQALGTRLFATSLLYALTMGWQPLVATWVVLRWVDRSERSDLALRPARKVFSLIGGAGALAFPLLAAALAWVGVIFGFYSPTTFSGHAEGITSPTGSTPWHLAIMACAFLGSLLLLWFQAFTEEVGWRGYFLPRAMQRLGRFRGLFAHGAVWGIWYAPVLFFSTYGELTPSGSVLRSLAFIVTSMLVGTLLGWLRLASRSLVPVVIANATLTLMAGLPYFVHGIDAGLRSAIFGAPGFIVLSVSVGLLALSRFRLAVRVPETVGAPSVPGMVLVRAMLREDEKARDGRPLH
jgi:membrane protease YdiL (CAAX protease family)